MAENTIARQDENLSTQGEETLPASTREENRYLVPPVDIFEKEDGLTLVFDMPGLTKDDLDLRVENQVLTLRGKVSRERPAEPRYEEFRLLDYFRQFQLSEDFDQEKIQAELTHGVLSVSLPRAEQAKPRRIEVKIG